MVAECPGQPYAFRDDWPRAQQAYFRAHRLDGARPDYAYNLAVSLDHLGQYRLAVSFYTKALELAQGWPGFDVTPAQQRLRQLQETVP